MWQCRENTKLRDTALPPDTRTVLTQDMITRGLPPENPATGAIAHIGGYGNYTAEQLHIAQNIALWGVDAIITSGNSSDAATYDEDVGQSYHDWISPYTGIYGASADTNKFWPAVGPVDNLALLQEFFPLLPNNGRYYEVVYGNVHFFVLNSNTAEPDGNTSVSLQAEWLMAKLALSASPWKVVVLHHSPYSLEADNSVMQWPFETWGAHMVLAGSDWFYERITQGNVPFINNGLGGASILAPTVPTDGRHQYSTLHGAGRITGTPLVLTYELVNIEGTEVDTVTLTKTDAGIVIT